MERFLAAAGELLVVADEEGVLRGLEFADHEERLHRMMRKHYGEHELREGKVAREIMEKLRDYFAGEIGALDELATGTNGTAFQKTVWKGLRGIRAGTTVSYGELAERIGRGGSSRAVGAANGMNPIAIVVPCHRVIGANGALTGYASGVEHKAWLLAHEAKHAR